MTLSETDILTEACRSLSPPKGNYLIDDFASNMILTVLDLQMQTTAVERAFRFFDEHRREELGSFEALKQFLANVDDDQASLEAAARYLWGYRLWTRVRWLRDLLLFFESQGVTDQAALQRWAETSDFDRDFRGKVKGLAYAAYNWLVMRQGIETIKPDVHVRRFVENALGRSVSDRETVSMLEAVAKALG